MTQPSNDPEGGAAEETFTRAQVRAMIGAELRKEREKVATQYADYDELKAKATAAAGEASKIDKLTEAVTALTTRAEKAESANMRREIADEFGLTAREARRLSGKTADELRADAEEMVEDLGIDVKARKAGKTTTATAPKGEGTDGDTGDGGDGAAETDDAANRTSRQPATGRTARPRETLTSGGTRTPTTPDETNPLKLAEAIPRR